MPRMRTVASRDDDGSPEADITDRPAACPARAWSRLTAGICLMASALITSTELVSAVFFCVP